MAPPDDGEEHSQAYYVIKAAQDREELQREGDDLDGKIRKAEREIRYIERGRCWWCDFDNGVYTFAEPWRTHLH